MHRQQTPQAQQTLETLKARSPQGAWVFVTCLCLAASAAAADWGQFRGPNCGGIADGAGELPTKFSDKENAAWSAPLGDGIGSPVVAAGRVFVSEMLEEDQTVALAAYDLHSGKRLWRRQWPAGDLPEIHKTNSHASTTAAADADRCYFYFSTLGMIAVDAATGEDVWRRELPTPYFVFKWGAGMSPVLYKNLVLFCQDDDLNPAFWAFDKRTGKTVWKDDRNDMAVNYSHPIVCSTDSGDEIVVAGTGLLVGYSPQTGKRLWTAKTLLRNIKTTPVARDGVVYLALQSGGIANQWLASVDRADTGNNDGKLTKDEIQAFVGKRTVPEAFYQRTFDKGDRNKDGVLEGEELDWAFLNQENFAGAKFDSKNPAEEFIVAVRGGGRGDVTKTHVLWKHPTKHTDHIVSPLVQDGKMLLIKAGGIATCFATKGGAPLLDPQRIGNLGGYFASPVAADGKIFMAGENGKVVVMKLAERLETLAINDMGDSILGTPAIAHNSLVIRTRNRLICVRQ